MAFFWTLVLWAAVFVAQQLLTPEPEFENARPASLDDWNFPTATEGRVLTLVTGTDEVKGPNVVWYGNYRAVPEYEKIKVNRFNSKKQLVGHKYYVGVQFGICVGPATLLKIWIGDDLAWSGTQSTVGDITLSHKNATGTFRFYPGDYAQGVDPYLSNHQSPCPAYRGMCYGVFEGGYVGKQPSMKAFSFEVSRIPNGLGLAGDGSVNTYDANPMNFAYEILTDTTWGFGYSASDIDTVQLTTDANTLTTEGNGISYTIANTMQAAEVLKEIEKQCDVRFRLDAATGKFTSYLIRDGYSLVGIKVLDSSNILELEDYSRGGWEGTVNHVRIQYKRRANKYTVGFAPAQDMANMIGQGRRQAATYNFTGVRDDTLANSLAWREVRAHSYPLAKARVKVNRQFWDVYVGEPVLFNYTCSEFDGENMPMRVIRSSVGGPNDPEIVLDLVQDVFTYETPSFADSDATAWTIPDEALVPFPAADQVVFEAPYAISRRDEYPSENRLWCGGVSQGKAEDNALIRQRNDTTDPAAGSFYDAGNINGFMYVGTLDGAITPDDTTIDVTTGMNATELRDVDDFDVGENLTNLVLIGGEFVSCQSASTISGGLRLNNCYRGMLDSAQAAHATAIDVYFIFSGGELTDTSFPVGNHVDIRLLPFRIHDGTSISEGDAGLTEIEIETDYRERRPYPPSEMNLNASDYPTGDVSLDVNNGSTEDTKGILVDYNRRDWRVYDEVSQLSVDASTLSTSPAFPGHNTTEYRLRIYNDPDGADTLIVTIDFADASSIFVSRTEILRYLVGVIPTKLRANITCRHTDDYAVVREAQQDLDYSFTTASAELAADNNWGVVSVVDTYTSDWTAPDTGNYAFKLGTSGPSVWASVNGGAEQQIITAASTTGTLTGVTVSDTIKIKYKGSVTGNETIVLVESPVDTEDSYVVFV
ncbi:MAG: hypothetical protein GY934_05095 [Gammaproteobacteria bacterium]|nr:hypothetical protein [Gammaproteobacteria bacterium]